MEGWQVKLELIMFGRLTHGDIPWTQVEVKALDCFVKITLVQCGYIEAMGYSLFAWVFCQVHFMDSSRPKFTNSMKYTLLAIYSKMTLSVCFDELRSFKLLDCQLHVAKSTLAACQLHFVNCPCPLHHVDCLNGWLLFRGCCKDLGVQGRSLGSRGLLKWSFLKTNFNKMLSKPQSTCAPLR
jgi:hypothetical protein